VRRFNFFNFAKQFDHPRSDLTKMILNPEVTVRSRGVMEKCTYCVQRIQAARIASVREGRLIADGEIQTACQQACPSRAIVFGDIADSATKVAQLMAGPRSYGMLDELNTQPRTRYLARIRNPNPQLEDVAHGHDHRAG
jgi:molybdopterin-containing oxidoreductase family iron-sulfur binding subunit